MTNQLYQLNKFQLRILTVKIEDSLSGTRPSDTDVEGPLAADPVLQLGKKKSATVAKRVKKPTETNCKQLCPVCKRGFQLRRLSPLHISCNSCKVLLHCYGAN